MQLKFGWDKVWNGLRRNPMRCNWILAMTQFGNVLEKVRNPMRSNWILAQTKFGIVWEEIRWDAIEFWLWHICEMS